MHTEFEVRILDVDKEKIIKKLEELNAQKIAEFDYKRRVYNFNPPTDHKWIRLRTDGKKTTLTIKKIESFSIDGTKEMEIEVSDFEETNKMLEEMGYKAHTYQENKRIRYVLNDVELDIDSWPYIPTYLEIEGKSENAVKEMMELLNVDKEKATSLDVQGVFKEFYNIDIAEVPVVKFDEPLDKKYYLS
ncbi:MAG: CYTH domain-containing protein [Clostridia bacterium]|nr:CYTH domain-containing protein [Clostridia bacterium]